MGGAIMRFVGFAESQWEPSAGSGSESRQMVKCECCHLTRPTTIKYPGLGYWCDDCMYDGCFADDQDGQNPYGQGTDYARTKEVHRRLGSPVT